MSAPVTRPSLIVRLRDPEDEEAWELFDRLYSPLIRNYCRRRGLQESDAHDVTQETVGAVSEAIRHFEYAPEKGAFHTWLLTFVRHRVNRFFRKHASLPDPIGSRIVDLAEETADGSAADEAAPWERDFRRLAFEVAARRVRPEVRDSTWSAFWRTAVDSEPPDAVAADLGLSVGAVYIARSRVIARLRRAVEEITADTRILEQLAS